MAKRSANSATYLPIVGVLAWLVPGLGHLYIGDKRRGLVLMVTIVATFWCGVMMVWNARHRGRREAEPLVHGADRCRRQRADRMGLARVDRRGGLEDEPGKQACGTRYGKQPGHWLGLDVGIHYTGVAGLLNLLAILDALARADRPPRRDEREAAIAGKRAGAKS